MVEAHRVQLCRGVQFFNQEEFYACHDVIEDVWLQESSEIRPFLQGVIQAAVAFYHYQHGKCGAARLMLQWAIQKLQEYPEEYQGLRIVPFVKALKNWKSALDISISGTNRAPIFLPIPKINQVNVEL